MQDFQRLKQTLVMEKSPQLNFFWPVIVNNSSGWYFTKYLFYIITTINIIILQSTQHTDYSHTYTEICFYAESFTFGTLPHFLKCSEFIFPQGRRGTSGHMATALFTHCVITLFISTVPLRHKYIGRLHIFSHLAQGQFDTDSCRIHVNNKLCEWRAVSWFKTIHTDPDQVLVRVTTLQKWSNRAWW